MVMQLRLFTIAISLAAISAPYTFSIAADVSATCGCDQPAEAADATIVTLERITAFSPRARSDLALAIVRLWKAPPPGELNNAIRVQHFMAQIATETGGFTTIEENLNYSAERLVKVFPTRVTTEQAARLAHRPELIANHVYGGRLGNNKPGDGWRFRGSGYMQLTGRANFKARGDLLKMSLVDNPDLVRQPSAGFKTATGFWLAKGISAVAEKDNLAAVRKLVNGGTNGLQESKVWLARAKRIFVEGNSPAESGVSDDEELAAVAESLDAEGFSTGTGPRESGATQPDPGALSDAIRNFQVENEIPATGVYDEATLYALGTPAPVNPLTDEELSEVQQRLQRLSLLSPTEAASAGEISEALKKFQLQQGLSVTGIYDEATLEMILPKQGEKPK